ncbi:MAG: hypothetical protein ACI94Y_000118 [Maribacter sp.]|jgi:hypothetical protein
MERFSNGKIRNIAPWWEPFYGISYLFRALVHDVFGVEWHLLSEANLQKISQESLSKVCECLKKDYKILAEEYGFKYRIIFHPNIWELNMNDDIFKDCSKELNEHGIENINLFTNFKALENPHDYYWRIDTHNNPKGYEFWAKEVYKEWDF